MSKPLATALLGEYAMTTKIKCKFPNCVLYFSTVYKCLDKYANVRCVKRIKLIQTTDIAGDAHFELIQQEIYLLQNLIHPRIIRFYSSFLSNDCDYIHIIMEYAPHGSLAQLIAKQLEADQFLDENVRKFPQILCHNHPLSESLLGYKRFIHRYGDGN